MTARPDEVVQRWVGLCVPSQVPGDTDMVTWTDYSKLSDALQSANARLAAVLAECERMKEYAFHRYTPPRCDAAFNDFAEAIRRAAAGEGDDSQGKLP